MNFTFDFDTKEREYFQLSLIDDWVYYCAFKHISQDQGPPPKKPMRQENKYIFQKMNLITGKTVHLVRLRAKGTGIEPCLALISPNYI